MIYTIDDVSNGGMDELNSRRAHLNLNFKHRYSMCVIERERERERDQGHSDGGGIGGYRYLYPPKSAQVNFLWGKMMSEWLFNSFIHPQKLLYPPKQISGYAPEIDNEFCHSCDQVHRVQCLILAYFGRDFCGICRNHC